MVSLAQKLKMPKTCDKRLYKHIRLVLCKNNPKKQLIFEKWDHFENWQKWPQCKGYSLCKVVSLGQKLKMPKTWYKTLYKHIRLVLCKNNPKKRLIFEKCDHFENWQKWPQCKGYSLCRKVSFSPKLKMPKTSDKRLYKQIRIVLWKKRLQKAANIWEMRPFWKLAKMATMQRLQPLQSGQFGSKIKYAKNMIKKLSTSTLDLFYAKNGSKKQLIFEKWDHFENWQKCPQCIRHIAFAEWSVWVKN